jgi:biotin carboxyl carrier protein
MELSCWQDRIRRCVRQTGVPGLAKIEDRTAGRRVTNAKPRTGDGDNETLEKNRDWRRRGGGVDRIVGFTVYQSGKNVVTVQTGKVQRQDLSSVVSASGEIKPKTYVNIGANAYGKITHLYVKEGDHVKKGQLLAQLENVQSSADVSANQASVQAAETDAIAADAALKTSDADLLRAQADYSRNKLDWDRAQNLYKDGLIAKSDFDSRQNAWATADAGLVQAKARVAQAKAQKDSADRHVSQARANLTRVADVLQKTTYSAPYDGVVTNLPVREGESVVIGIQNALGSTLLTLADMSVITAEVKVDETDIVNVHLGQASRSNHRRHSSKNFPRHRFRNRRQRHRALHRRGHFAAGDCQRRSERLQSGRNRDRSLRRICAPDSRPPRRSRRRPGAACSPFQFKPSPFAPRRSWNKRNQRRARCMRRRLRPRKQHPRTAIGRSAAGRAGRLRHSQ